LDWRFNSFFSLFWIRASSLFRFALLNALLLLAKSSESSLRDGPILPQVRGKANDQGRPPVPVEARGLGAPARRGPYRSRSQWSVDLSKRSGMTRTPKPGPGGMEIDPSAFRVTPGSTMSSSK
jgi:hypothetical protein